MPAGLYRLLQCSDCADKLLFLCIPSNVLRLPTCAQKEQEASKQYKKWLESLAQYSRALLGAKAALATAQAEAKEVGESAQLDCTLICLMPRFCLNFSNDACMMV